MGYGHHLGGSSINYSQNECLHEEKLLLEMTPDVDSDNFDLAEVGCEHIMIGSRTCSVPYELYDLPDLKGVLSLETWNHQLNEDERFFLATFLPDMDQETFWLTVKELLTGDEMLFGSPLHKFYTGMKGGLYSPQVTYSRECLVFLQKNEYYHRVRSYHENMLQAFSEMKKLWDGCGQNLTVEERIHIWKSRRENKPRFLVDLNTFPDEDILNKCDESVESLPSSKAARCVNGHYSTILLNGLVRNINRKGKGVLKLKPILTKPVQSQVMEPSPDKPEQPSKGLPKGVLRIKRKYDHHSQVTPRVNLEQISAWNNCAPNFSSHQFALKKDEGDISEKSPILCQMNRDGSAFRSPEIIHGSKRQEIPYAYTKFSEIFEKEPKMKNYVRQDGPEICRKQLLSRFDQNLSNYALDAGHSGDCQNMTKKTSTVLKGRQNIPIEENSAGTRKCHLRLAVENHKETRLNTTAIREGLLISDVRSDNSEHLGNGSKIDRANVAVSGAEKCPMFPITYKRKKPYKKVNHKDTLKQQPQEPVAVCLDSSTPIGAVKPQRMAIKIKFRGLTGQSG
ncbi:uncharacterized protein LOC121970118 [Zingiber officinale]|uniref:DEUBAD domain-containing protein n=1 Tax=Zingiber officinale TaxID=94328 RepID=A0A8J5LDL2_ZINOF|nr:uncharacterized protein LOC121970118 [Zingiber officinale]KAG6514384.1 hypothetical protein ZIOFF_024737 [Zingiber officinale]